MRATAGGRETPAHGGGRALPALQATRGGVCWNSEDEHSRDWLSANCSFCGDASAGVSAGEGGGKVSRYGQTATEGRAWTAGVGEKRPPRGGRSGRSLVRKQTRWGVSAVTANEHIHSQLRADRSLCGTYFGVCFQVKETG